MCCYSFHLVPTWAEHFSVHLSVSFCWCWQTAPLSLATRKVQSAIQALSADAFSPYWSLSSVTPRHCSLRSCQFIPLCMFLHQQHPHLLHSQNPAPNSLSEPFPFPVPQLGTLFLFSSTLLFLSDNLSLTFWSCLLICNYLLTLVSCNTLLYCIFTAIGVHEILNFVLYCYCYNFLTREKPWWLKKYKRYYEICLVVNLLWPIVINKTIMQQNRIKTLHHNGNPLE